MTVKDRFWRSLEQREGAPEAARFAAGEFPEGADSAPDGMSRRQMLALMGATVSMAGLVGCRRPEETIVPYVVPPEEIIPGVAQYYATTMPLGTGAYGLVVESHEGRPTKIEGNPQHPATLGSSSALMQAATAVLYDPDRSRAVRQGDGASTWEAFAAAAASLHQRHQADAGRGLAVLAEPWASPTMARQAAAFRARFPQARWVTYTPLGDEEADAGIAAASGRDLVAMNHPGQAQVILAIDSDFLVGDAEATRHAREFADGRRLAASTDTMNRLYAVESRMSATGGSADHRVRLRAGDMGAFTAALAGALGVPGAAGGTLPAGVSGAWLAGLVADLTAAGGAGLVLAGAHLPPAVHGAVLAINHHLGHVGRTVTLHEPLDSARSRRSELPALVKEMNSGAVQTLLVLGGNPVYNAPADLGLAQAMGQVETVIHLGLYRDETAALANWHVPEAHFLESWSDARALGGIASVVQPLIAPLHGGRTAAEVVAVLAGGEPVPAYDLVRATWRGILGEDAFDLGWQKLLHDGVYPGSETPGTDLAAAPVMPPALTAPAADALELVFEADPSVLDGRFANVAWLQELPDPVSKLTWDNALTMSPVTARSLAVTNGDMVRLSHGDVALEVAVMVTPGRADGSLGLTLGYGRTAAGRVGDGVGFNSYALRTRETPWIAAAPQVEKTGGRYLLATTQDHWDIDSIGERGRDDRLPVLLRSGTLAEYRQDPEFVSHKLHHPELESIYPDHNYDEGPQWGMAIDLTTCTGCNACVVACQSENNVPVVGKDEVSRGREMHWIRIDRYYSGESDNPEQLAFQPVTCQHCENAPCEEVCPVGATVHDDEGLNSMVYNRCIGTRYCSNNCAYKVRRFNYYNLTKDTPELMKMAQNPDVTIRSRGVMEKCTFCTQRIQAAKIGARAQGRELAADEVQTACQQSCPARAISFGDIRNSASQVTKDQASNRAYVMLAELNNRPRTSFLARIRNRRDGLGEA